MHRSSAVVINVISDVSVQTYVIYYDVIKPFLLQSQLEVDFSTTFRLAAFVLQVCFTRNSSKYVTFQHCLFVDVILPNFTSIEESAYFSQFLEAVFNGRLCKHIMYYML